MRSLLYDEPRKLQKLHISEAQGMKSKYMIAKQLNPLGKIMNKTCIEIEAPDQRQKYSPKNPQVWEKV